MKKIKVDIIIPICSGDAHELEWSINKQLNFFRKNLQKYNWQIIIVNNGHNEGRILNIIKKLMEKNKEIKYIYTPYPGRGHGLKKAWLNSNADTIMYMDLDLSTDLKYVIPLIKEITNGNDIVTGSRYVGGALIKRTLARLILSKTYNTVFTRLILGAKFKDSQCGFKAINKKTAKELIPQIKDNNWFFDTELLYLGQKKGYNIKEIPIKWIEDKNSRVKLFKTSLDYIKKIIELKKRKI